MPIFVWHAIRTDDAVSASTWLATLGRLTSAANTKSETATDRIVRIVRRLLRERFSRTSVLNFMEDTLIQVVGLVDEPLGAGIVRDHHDRFVVALVELVHQREELLG